MTLRARTTWLTVGILAVSAFLWAGDKKEKGTQGAQQVDSGSFGVFIRGQRVVTETFSVHQENGISDVKSHLQETAGAAHTNQHSELQMTASGEMVRYEWSAAHAARANRLH